MPLASQFEIYVRFRDRKTGRTGIHETPCANIEDAAALFADDADSLSAMAMAFDENGRVTRARDVTPRVIDALVTLIQADCFNDCPHPMVEEAFESWQRDVDRATTEQHEHERVELAMLHM